MPGYSQIGMIALYSAELLMNSVTQDGNMLLLSTSD
jgi:hypothetical protein